LRVIVGRRRGRRGGLISRNAADESPKTSIGDEDLAVALCRRAAISDISIIIEACGTIGHIAIRRIGKVGKVYRLGEAVELGTVIAIEGRRHRIVANGHVGEATAIIRN